MFRRVTAFLVLVVTLAMNVEVGFGLARDGDVHHESETMAVKHAQAHVGPVVGHGHEDRYDPEFVHGHPGRVTRPPSTRKPTTTARATITAPAWITAPTYTRRLYRVTPRRRLRRD